MTSLGVAVLVAGASGCGDPSATVPTRDAEEAFVFFSRVLQPPGRTNFVSILPSLEGSEVDLSSARLELGGFSRVRVFEGDLLVFFGESGEIARYVVEPDLSLTERARLSMVNEGVSSFFNTIIFVSPTRAYYVHAEQSQVVVWNPREMTVTGTFALDLRVEAFEEVIVGPPTLLQDQILLPVAWVDRVSDEPRRVVGVARLSANEDRLIGVSVDDRCGFSLAGFADAGKYYAVGDWRGGVYTAYADVVLPPPCLLEFDPSTAEFSESELDLNSVTGAPAVDGAFGLGNGTFAVRVYDAPIDFDSIRTDYPDPNQYFNLEVWRWGTINLSTGRTELVEDLPLSAASFAPVIIDGNPYVGVAEESLGRSTFFRIQGSSATPIIRAPGEILNVLRIR
ncbi:MAG: hypothetical protein AAF436_19880 [Myxococcota bacterium]